MAHADKSDKQSDMDPIDDSTLDTHSKDPDESRVEVALHADQDNDLKEEGEASDSELEIGGQASDSKLAMDDQGVVSAEELVTQLESAREEVTNFKDVALRAEAELQNIRRRSERDIQNAHKFGLERFLSSLLPVIDSLEKAIETANQSDDKNDAIIEGVDISLKMLLDLLKKENIEQIDPEGEPFDPQYHEAMSVMANPDVEPNTVLNVFQKGYTLNGRLVRAAMVIVSKVPEENVEA